MAKRVTGLLIVVEALPLGRLTAPVAQCVLQWFMVVTGPSCPMGYQTRGGVMVAGDTSRGD
jgi:hypothetical protein